MRKVRLEEGEGGDSVGPAKDRQVGVAKEKMSGLSAVRKAMIKNGDMFSEDLFGEKLLVLFIIAFNTSLHCTCIGYLSGTLSVCFAD